LKKVLGFLVKNGINCSILIMMFVLTIFVSSVINNYQTVKFIGNTSFQQVVAHENKNQVASVTQNDSNYRDFLIRYYETQADWLGKWLAALGILAGFIGIVIPMFLNASYKEKVKEIQQEFERNKESITKEKEMLENAAKRIEEDYSKRIEQFEADMQQAIIKAETDGILSKMGALKKEAARHQNKGDTEKRLQVYDEIINIGTKAILSYRNSESFRSSVAHYLQDAHYSRGLVYRSALKQYSDAIADFEKTSEYNKILGRQDTPALKECFLECYILDSRFEEGIEITKTITQVNKEKLDGSAIFCSTNFFEILKNTDNKKAKELLSMLEKISIE